MFRAINFFKTLTLVSCFFISGLISGQIADFSANNFSGCAPLSVNFTDISTGSISTWEWSFDNGNTSVLQNPGALFTNPGTYNITLKVTDAANNTSTKARIVTVFKNPTADFTANKNEICVGQNVAFTNRSTRGDGALSTQTWDFGNGATSTLNNPLQTYNSPGTFRITLVVRDVNGCKSEKTVASFIKVNPNPTIAIDADKKYGCNNPTRVNFTNAVSGGTAPFSFAWQFGDGKSSTLANPSNDYSNNNNYSVTLKATDSKGCESTTTFDNYILIAPLKAEFSTKTPKLLCGPTLVEFKNESTPSSSNYKSTWYFGDGTKSIVKNALKSYAIKGFYSVKLVIEIDGCKDSITKKDFLELKDKPTGKITIKDTVFCENGSAPFSFSNVGMTSYDWRMSSGNMAEGTLSEWLHNGRTGTYPVNSKGEFRTKVLIKDGFGCTNEIKGPTIQYLVPEPIIKAVGDNFCVGTSLYIDNLSTSVLPIIKYGWKWEKGDSGTSTKFDKQLTKQIYSAPDTGNFGVSFWLINSNNCKRETNDSVSIGMKLKPNNFGTLDQEICPNGTTIAYDSTTNLPFNPHGRIWTVDGSEYDSFIYPKPKPLAVWDTGYHNFGLKYMHFGCPTDSVKLNYLYITPLIGEIFLHDSIKCQSTAKFTPQVLYSKITSHYKVTYPDLSTTYDSVKEVDLKAGDHEFKLEIWDTVSKCNLIYSVTLRLVPPPLHMPIVSSVGVCAPATITGQVVDGKEILSTAWFLGDSLIQESLKENNPFFKSRYVDVQNLPGTFKYKLIVYRQNGCDLVDSLTINVQGPKAKASIKQLNSCFPIRFEVTDSLFVTDNTLDRYWLAGTDTFRMTAITQSFEANTLNFVGNSYVLTYSINNSNGCGYIDQLKIPMSNSVPDIRANPSPTCNYPNYRITLFNFEIGNNPIEWHLDGVKDNRTGRIINHQFLGAGPHTIRATYLDTLGCKYSGERIIMVDTPSFSAQFTVDKTLGTCPPLKVKFTNKSKYNPFIPTTFLWSFGDGSTSTLENPEKIYVLPDNYTVKLRIRDATGCTDSITAKDLIKVKGPKGSFAFPESKGCAPVSVNFNFTNQDAAFFKWDLADGTLDSLRSSLSHSYDRPGFYIPLMILSDSFGCSFSLPQKDTIFVYPYPEIAFGTNVLCQQNTAPLNAIVNPKHGDTVLYNWLFSDGTGSRQKNPLFVPPTPGIHSIQLIASNIAGCKDTATNVFTVPMLNASHNKKAGNACLNDTVHILNNSQSSEGISTVRWQIKDSIYHTNKVVLRLSKIGRASIKLWITDVLGCKDSLMDFTGLLVGDTNPPNAVPFYRVSVENNQAVSIKYGMANNVDFMAYHVINPANGNPWFINRVYNDTLNEIQGLNTLKNTYCFKISNVNGCLKSLPLDSIVTHCSIEVSGKADTNKSHLKWNAYRGWPVSQYQVYRDDVANPKGFVLVGTVAGDILAFTDTVILCYTKHIYRIKALEKNGSQEESWSDTCHVLPLWKNTVPVGENWRVTVENNEHTLLEWMPVSQAKIPIKDYIPYRKEPNGNTYLPFDTINGLSWNDMKTSVNESAYLYRVKARDTCNDLSAFNKVSKSILLRSSFNLVLHRPELNWNSYFKWNEGVEIYEVERQNEQGIFEKIGETEDTVFVDKNVQVNCSPSYVYRVKALRNQPLNGTWEVESVSNHSIALPKSTLFVPNAFTPNADGLNESFAPVGTYISQYKLLIFNRWGEQLFETTECMKAWDASYKGEKCMQGVYAYLIFAKGVDGKLYNFKGNVTLLE